MNDSNKQVWLILAHAFNMDGQAASQAITDKIPHFINLGIVPIVVSGALGTKDKVVEHHQILPALPVALRFDLRHYFRLRISSRVLYRIVMLAISLALLPFYIIEKFFIRIETSWSWAITAYITCLRIIRERKPVVIYSAGGAYAAHLAAYWLKLRFGLPWVAEIYDPMIFPGQTTNKMRIRFSTWLEGKICKHADVAVWFTQEALARARARHPELGERGHCIIPGGNAPEFTRTPYQRGKHLVIGYFGTLAKTRNLEIFLQGLRKFIEKNPQHAEQIRLHIYGGRVDAISANALREFPFPMMIEQFGRIETDRITGESGRDQVLKRMNAADCLLLLHGTVPFCEEYFPSKLYEYLWSQRPILALVWRNPQLERILRELGHWTASADDADSIVTALEELYVRWMNDDLADSGIASPYTVEASTRQIYALAHTISTQPLK